MKNDDRKITFIFNAETEEVYEVGKESKFGIVTGIWVSHEPNDYFARVMSDTSSVSFKGIPFILEEKKR